LLYAKPIGFDAAALPEAPFLGESFEGTLCGAVEDWLVTSVGAGETLDVSVVTDPPGARVRVDVLTDWGHLRAEGIAPSDRQRLLYPRRTDDPPEALLQIRPAPEAADIPGGITYDLRLAWHAAPVACGDDLHEDNDTAATATWLATPRYPTAATPREIFDATGVVCPGDDDWFALESGPDEVVHGLLQVRPYALNAPLAPLGCEVVDGAGVATACVTAGEYHGFTALGGAAGPIRLHLWAAGSEALPAAYELTLVRAAAPPCLNDPWDVSAPTEVRPVLAPMLVETPDGAAREATWSGVLCPGETDVYGVSLTVDPDLGGQVLVADLRTDTPDADLTLVLRDPYGAEVRRSQTSLPHEQVAYLAAGVGQHELVITGNGVPTDYTLHVSVTPTWVCGSDPHGPNHSLRDPPPPVLTPHEVVSGQLCAGESDYFAVYLTAGQTLVADLHAHPTLSDSSLFLYNPDGRVVALERITRDDVWLRYTAPSHGWHTLRIIGGLGGNMYSLHARLLDAEPPCSDDELAADSFDAPAALTVADAASLTLEGVLCPLDEDWFAVELGVEDTLLLELWGADGATPLEIACLGPSGDTRGRGAETELPRRAFCAASEAGLHRIRIFRPHGLDGEPAPYALTVTRTICNSAFDSSYQGYECKKDGQLALPATHTRALCPGELQQPRWPYYERDTYRLPAAQGQTVEVKLEYRGVPNGFYLSVGRYTYFFAPEFGCQRCACRSLSAECMLAGCGLARPSIVRNAFGMVASFPVLRSATYGFTIIPVRYDVPMSYTVAFSVREDCPNDPYEREESYETNTNVRAQVPADGDAVTARICPRDRDTFTVTIPTGRWLRQVRLRFDRVRGDLRLGQILRVEGASSLLETYDFVGVADADGAVWNTPRLTESVGVVVEGASRFVENDYTLEFVLEP